MDVGLIILDGWGMNTDSNVRDAVRSADIGNFPLYWKIGAQNQLDPSGRRVGLPDGQMG
ncbi:MAG: 2,3-bisphosphoglycerate-independent phosphoglycerate mutase, partial [Halococcoides sp.]